LRHQQVPDGRLALAGLRTKRVRIDGNLPSARHVKPAVANRFFGCKHRPGTDDPVSGKKENTNRGVPVRLKPGIQAARFPGEKLHRKLDGNARAVTAGPVSIHTPAVRQTPQALQRLGYNAM
jgi:hypothetical protein